MKRWVLNTAIVPLLGAALLAGPALAAPVLYDCTVKQTGGPQGWVSTRTALVLDGEGGGQVIDALTLNFDTGALPVRLREKGDTLRLSWTFKGLNLGRGGSISAVIYRGTLNTQTGAFTVRGRSTVSAQTVRGQGACVTRKDLSARQLKKLLRG